MRDYTKYKVWNDSIDLAMVIYNLTKEFPSDERFGLISQLRRAAVSIPSNIAEGCSRSSEKEFNRYLEISIGSSFEVKTQLIIAKKLNFGDQSKLNKALELVDSISKQINALRNKVKG
jgi:four helix bundle protein